jgi:hypothetical protein
MPLRTFRDRQGIEWRMWDVHPQWTDRRGGERRSSPDSDYNGPERRKLPGRRWSAPDTEPRVRVRPGFEKGWLACESDHERRRFAPVPEHWEEFSDAQLELLCQHAEVYASRSRTRLIE